MVYQHDYNWVVLILLMLAGALIRLFFVLRHKGPNRWEFPAAAIALIAAVAVIVAPKTEPAAAAAPVATFAQVRGIVHARCAMCHNEQVISKNVQLHTTELIGRNAQQLYQQAVVLKAMPMNNATQITDAERNVLRQWYEAGAKID
jgi:uncharacterized membrane protein